MHPRLEGRARAQLLYAVLIAKRKLIHYFDRHAVTVVSTTPLGEIIRNRDATSRIVKWALELSGLDISYVLRTAIKSQTLGDFVAPVLYLVIY